MSEAQISKRHDNFNFTRFFKVGSVAHVTFLLVLGLVFLSSELNQVY